MIQPDREGFYRDGQGRQIYCYKQTTSDPIPLGAFIGEGEDRNMQPPHYVLLENEAGNQFKVFRESVCPMQSMSIKRENDALEPYGLQIGDRVSFWGDPTVRNPQTREREVGEITGIASSQAGREPVMTVVSTISRYGGEDGTQQHFGRAWDKRPSEVGK